MKINCAIVVTLSPLCPLPLSRLLSLFLLLLLLFSTIGSGLRIANLTTKSFASTTTDLGSSAVQADCLFPSIGTITFFSISTYFVLTDKFIGFEFPESQSYASHSPFNWIAVLVMLIMLLFCTFLFV